MKMLQNIPAFKFSMIMIIGILAGSEIHFNLLLTLILLVVFSILLFVYCKKSQNISIALTFTILILFGILKSNIDFFIFSENSVKFIPDTGNKSFVRLKGIVSEIPDYDSNKIKLVVDVREIYKGKDTINLNGTVLVSVYENIFIKTKYPQTEVKAGDEVLLKGKILEPTGSRNPGEFDYKNYLFLHNIYKTFRVTGYENVKVISHDNLSYFYQKIVFPCKIFALNNIDRNIKGDGASYLKGLVTGERTDISPEMKDAFINAGVMHLIAVSGLNVAYIIISVTLILSLFRIPVFPRTVITISLLIFYCIFTGSPPSIVRATIMGILILISFVIERKVNFYNTIGVSALLILIFDTKQLFDPGFILSFTAVISMVFIYNLMEKLFLYKFNEFNFSGKKYLRMISILFFTTLAAQLGTLPVTANYFGKISIVSLLANVVVVPLANLSLAIGFFQILTGIFSDYLSSIIAEANNIMLSSQLFFIKWCASFKFAYINIQSFNFSMFILYYIVLLLMLTIKNTKEVIRNAVLISLSVSIYISINYDFNKKLRITFMDIGQGDCVVIQTPDDKVILVDCGLINDNYNSGERTIDPYFRRNGIDKIDILVLTHLHNDHIGGINFLLQNYKIGKVIESGQIVETPLTFKMDSLIQIKNIPREIVRAGDLINELKDLRLYFLFPDNKFVNNSGKTLENNLNNGSVAFILKYKESEIFFSGDIEKEGEKFLYENYSDFLKTDILKVAHHGSITSTSIPFILKNKPEIAVISCGMFNKFNHPSDIILNRLESSGAVIFRTDENNAVVIESDGYKESIIDWK
jgi:competence protein ComEC